MDWWRQSALLDGQRGARLMPARLRAIVADRRGGIALVTALLAPAMVGFVGIGTEVGLWLYTRQTMQGAADSAARRETRFAPRPSRPRDRSRRHAWSLPARDPPAR